MKAYSTCWLVLMGVYSVSGLNADDAKPKDAAVDRLREVVEQVRKAEERYPNLETFVRVTSQYEVGLADANDKQNLSKSEEISYMRQQGDLFLFKWREVSSFGDREPTITFGDNRAWLSSQLFCCGFRGLW